MADAPSTTDLAQQIRDEAGQIALVFQGGGALGAYQVGVYQALHEAGIEPDWVVGTSIGAINAGLIAGNRPENRMAALDAFWDTVSHSGQWHDALPAGLTNPPMGYWATLMQGLPGFFRPNWPAFWGMQVPLAPERAGYYTTQSLRDTLADLIDLDLLNADAPRLTVGAAEVRTSRMHYFDSRDCALGIDHIVASGALPPAFPPVRLGKELYWDGGILSNTPTEVIFDDTPRQNSLVFAVHLWNPEGEEPGSMIEVMERQKDIQFSSRVASQISQAQQMHRLRHIIKELASRLPASEANEAKIQEMVSWGCLTRMHVVRLVAPRLRGDDFTKDVDFSTAGISDRRALGYEHTLRALDRAPWRDKIDPMEGVILHDDPAHTGLLHTGTYVREASDSPEKAADTSTGPSLRIVR